MKETQCTDFMQPDSFDIEPTVFKAKNFTGNQIHKS